MISVPTRAGVAPADARSRDSSVPRLADGVELLGEYEGSGFKEPHYLVRRADGQVIQLSRLLYVVTAAIDGRRDLEQIAQRVSQEAGRELIAEQAGFLVESKLRPLGVLAAAGDGSPEPQRLDLLLALKVRGALVPERVVGVIAGVLGPLFWPPVVLAALAGLVAVDVWLFSVHGIAQSLRGVVSQPVRLLMVLGLLLVSMAFHECGHAAACRYGGAKPGVMGVGLYLIWPTFYTNVTDAYRLGKAGRLRTDLGGVYFNAVFVLVIAAVYFLTGFEALLVVIVIEHLGILEQFLPFVRLDGYYVVADLTGVPDLFRRVKPILRSLLPGRDADSGVKELKPWVRRVVTGWVLLTVPVLMGNLALLIMQTPRILTTAQRSFSAQLVMVSNSFRADRPANAILGVVSIVALALPVAGLAVLLAQLGHRVGGATLRGPLRWSKRRRLLLAAELHGHRQPQGRRRA